MSHHLRVVVDREECFSMGVCTDTLPSVFVWDDNEKPVVQPFDLSVVTLESLTEAVEGCPRGALSLVAEGDAWTSLHAED